MKAKIQYLMIGLLLISIASAVDAFKACSTEGFDTTCATCSFDESGKVDGIFIYSFKKERAEKELKEQEILNGYLPKQLSDEELVKIVGEVMGSLSEPHIGKVIAGVQQRTGARADSRRIADLVKSRFIEDKNSVTGGEK